MIRELRIKNLALIGDLNLALERGFTVFTGETGAGKSILAGAIGLLLGERASGEQIRSGTDEAEVSGVFELQLTQTPIMALLEQLAVPADEGALIVRRVISRTGKNRIYINQVPVPLSSLKSIGDHLVDLHGQHDHQSLFNPETAQVLIDGFPAVESPARRYLTAWEAYVRARNDCTLHEKQAREIAVRKDIIEYQYKELNDLDLHPTEEQNLQDELTRCSSSTERAQHAAEVLKVLTEGNAALEKNTNQLLKELRALSKFDPSVEPWTRDVESSLTVFVELESFFSSYLNDIGSEADPARLEYINARLSKIQRLKKKYGCDYEGVRRKRDELKSDLDTLDNSDSQQNALEKRREEALEECRKIGVSLSKARVRQAREFDKNITGQMAKLGFEGGRWKTEFTGEKDITSHGFEQCSFTVRTNPGEPFLPLVKTASGGEISRLMLAIKTIMANQDNIPILIFDEIDAGIGGILAGEIAKCLHALSNTHQVLCISHLHQIASRADHHIRVYKETTGEGRVLTRARILSEKEKISEIARMLGGESDISKKHAAALLKRA